MSGETVTTADLEPARSRRRRWPYVLLALVLALLILVGAGLAWGNRALSSNIDTIDTETLLGDDRPTRQSDGLNVLLIGSDTRSTESDFIGGGSAGLADTTIVLHLSGDGTWATGVSIPRDSMVQMPDCVTPSGAVRPGGLRQFNWAFSIGGATCAQRTVEATTGVRIDHLVVVDFSGFITMIDALGGVELCFDDPVTAPGLSLPAGCQTLDGETALRFVRVRKGIGNGSDIGRIQRQQQFLGAVARQARGMVTRPVALYEFLDAATSAITTDKGLGSVMDLSTLALRFRDAEVEFMTVPITGYAPDPNRVAWRQPEADQLWEQLRADERPTPSD